MLETEISQWPLAILAAPATQSPHQSHAQLQKHDELQRLVQSLLAQGYVLAGCYQINEAQPGSERPDMILHDIRSGRRLSITQNLGPLSEGCRLDTSRLIEAVTAAQQAVAEGCDVLIVNKFGKEEAAGRGFVPLIADCLSRDIAVIIGPSAASGDAFAAIIGLDKNDLTRQPADMLAWLGARRAARAHGHRAA